MSERKMTISSIDGELDMEISSVVLRPALQVFLPESKQSVFLSMKDTEELVKLLNPVSFQKMFEGMY